MPVLVLVGGQVTRRGASGRTSRCANKGAAELRVRVEDEQVGWGNGVQEDAPDSQLR